MELRQLKDFSDSCVDVFSHRWKLFVGFNLLFFGCILVTLVVATLVSAQQWYFTRESSRNWFLDGGWSYTLLIIIGANLQVSSLQVILPGVLFFPLSIVNPVYTAMTIGLMMYFAQSAQFFMILPTVILEGEAIVLSAMAGTLIGASWLVPKRLYGPEGPSRTDALIQGCEEAVRVLAVAIIVFIISAAVETLTIYVVTSA